MAKKTRRIPRKSSKKAEDRKRGRPPLLPADVMAKLRARYPDVTTRRGLLNVYYRTEAMDVLHEDARFHWLTDSGRPKWKASILTELGRTGDVERMRIMAARICELKPRVKEAVAMIRGWRMGKKGEGSAADLAAAVAGAIDLYLAGHPKTTWRQVRVALGNTLAVIDEIEAGSAWENHHIDGHPAGHKRRDGG